MDKVLRVGAMEHDVNEETRPHTLDFKVEKAIKNKTYNFDKGASNQKDS